MASPFPVRIRSLARPRSKLGFLLGAALGFALGFALGLTFGLGLPLCCHVVPSFSAQAACYSRLIGFRPTNVQRVIQRTLISPLGEFLHTEKGCQQKIIVGGKNSFDQPLRASSMQATEARSSTVSHTSSRMLCTMLTRDVARCASARESTVYAGTETAFVRVASRFARISSCTEGASRSMHARRETISHRLLERLMRDTPDARHAASITPRAIHR